MNAAYLVDKATIDEIVSSLLRYQLTTSDMADYVGQELRDENLRSFTYSVRNDDGASYDLDASREAVANYQYESTRTTVGQRARSLTNYCDQTMQHPAWPDSEARDTCHQLAFAMLQEIAGYHEADVR